MSEEELRQEKLLVKKAKRNNKDFGALYSKYSTKIHNFVLKKVNNEPLAADLTSRVFEKAMNNLDSYQWQGVSFGSWLYRIARNTVYDYYRTNKANRRENLDEEMIESDENPDENIFRDERELALYSVISQLNNKDQYLLYYKYFDELDNKEIADRTGLSEQNVATKLHRIRKKMEKLLKDNISF
ncbi:MAG: sigma-70 family RNA polymerase sigma factor [bacterium]